MLHLTKVAFGAQSLDDLLGWWAGRGPVRRINTRYRPKRHAELVGGSIFWILKHTLVARTEIMGFEEGEAGRTDIVVASDIRRVLPQPRRAHQGWRYLEADTAPRDMLVSEGSELPPEMMGKLAALGLL